MRREQKVRPADIAVQQAVSPSSSKTTELWNPVSGLRIPGAKTSAPRFGGV
jgi:hypothetical protein